MSVSRFRLGVVALVLALALAAGVSAQQITLNINTAGDQNMVDFFQNELAPEFEKLYPEVRVRVVGTGPGPAGSQRIVEKLRAQQRAGRAEWDVDVAVVHELGAAWAVQEGLFERYTGDVSTSGLVVMPAARKSLGVAVDGYVMPMFLSQTAIAYDPDRVANPPRSYDELVTWVQQNPRRFGYNGIQGGASGIAFTAGWLYWYTGDYDVLANGPFSQSVMDKWPQAFEALRDFNRHVIITSGNAGTLDMLNRGEIAMGPVWVDMFYTWMAEGRLDPKLRLFILEPGMPGQPMFYAIPAGASQPEYARKFIEFATSPEVQARYIVERFNWYPGIDANAVRHHVTDEVWATLFRDISPEELNRLGQVFPLNEYFEAMLEAYERYVR